MFKKILKAIAQAEERDTRLVEFSHNSTDIVVRFHRPLNKQEHRLEEAGWNRLSACDMLWFKGPWVIYLSSINTLRLHFAPGKTLQELEDDPIDGRLVPDDFDLKSNPKKIDDRYLEETIAYKAVHASAAMRKMVFVQPEMADDVFGMFSRPGGSVFQYFPGDGGIIINGQPDRSLEDLFS